MEKIFAISLATLVGIAVGYNFDQPHKADAQPAPPPVHAYKYIVIQWAPRGEGNFSWAMHQYKSDKVQAHQGFLLFKDENGINHRMGGQVECAWVGE